MTGAAAFEVVDRVTEDGNDPRRLVADLLKRLRDLAILAAAPDATEKGLTDSPADIIERILRALDLLLKRTQFVTDIVSNSAGPPESRPCLTGCPCGALPR